jgi:hypothetical protein
VYKTKYYFYEIISISFGLALLTFFGTLSFFPIELMLLGEGQTWFWVFIFLGLSIIVAFLLISFYKREHALIIIRIFDVLSTIIAVIAIITFLIFTKDLLDAWFVQGGWYLRYHGLIIGPLIACIMIKTIAGFSFLISKLNEPGVNDEKSGDNDKQKNIELTTLLIIVSSFIFYISAFLIYRYFYFLNVLITIFIIQIFLLILSIPLLSHTKFNDYVKLSSIESEIITRKSKYIVKVNKRLIDAGTAPRDFWKLFTPLFFIGIFVVIIVFIYVFDIFIHVSFPRELDIPVVQILSYILLIGLLFILSSQAFKGRTRRKIGDYYIDKKLGNFKRSFLGFLDSQKVLGIFLVMSQVIYYFEFPIYYPNVVSSYLLFGIVGAVIYYALGRSEKRKQIIYITAIIMLILNFLFVYLDGVLNYKNVEMDPSFDIYFPFLYLHSWVNNILVGIPIGIILSDVLLNFAFKHTDGTDSTNRALFFTFSCFIFAFLTMLLSYFLNTPGGDPNLFGESTFFFSLLTLILVIVLILGLSYHILNEIILPKAYERKITAKKNSLKQIKTKENPKDPRGFKKKTIALLINTILVISILGGLLIFFTYQETHKKPVLVYSPGNYYIWLQNSSEKVSKNYEISVESSPKIDAVDLSLAKNEYGAFQLVWRPLGITINSLSFLISDFVHKQNSNLLIGSGNFSLRYEEFVMEEEFPDILKPFSSMNLDKPQNHVFWFSGKTPYNMSSGIYQGNITFIFNDVETETINIRLNIWNFTVPEMRHLRTSFGGFVENDEILDTYLYHRFNDYGVRIYQAETIEQLQTEETYTCYLNKSANDWIFNWTWWDNGIEKRLNNSMNAFGFRDPLSMHRDPQVDNSTMMLWLQKWLQEVENHLVSKNWINYGYYYFIDEFNLNIPAGYTKEQYYVRLETFLQIMKAAAPNLKIMSTGPPEADTERFSPYFDIYCPVSDMYNKDRWDALMNDGAEFWYYPCVGPYAPWPNSHLYNRLYESRILLWQTWYYNIHGYLYWHSHAYWHGTYGMAFNGYGEGWFIYERDGQVYDSLRWENYLDGQEDYEYIWLLDAVLSYLKLHPEIIPESTVKNKVEDLQAIINSIVGEKWKYTGHPSTLYAGRDKIGAILHELSGLVNITAIGEAPWFPPL